eukprot:1149965-Pelagomonas_calceolata.AAC.1
MTIPKSEVKGEERATELTGVQQRTLVQTHGKALPTPIKETRIPRAKTPRISGKKMRIACYTMLGLHADRLIWCVGELCILAAPLPDAWKGKERVT